MLSCITGFCVVRLSHFLGRCFCYGGGKKLPRRGQKNATAVAFFIGGPKVRIATRQPLQKYGECVPGGGLEETVAACILPGKGRWANSSRRLGDSSKSGGRGQDSAAFFLPKSPSTRTVAATIKVTGTRAMTVMKKLR